MSCEKCEMAAKIRRQVLLSRGLLCGEFYTFSMTNPTQELTWSTDVAQSYIRAGKAPIVKLDTDALAEWIATYADVHEDHLDHIPPESIYVPGILILIASAPKPGDPIEIFPVLMDGTHRATRALREGRPFFAYLLNDDQQMDCRFLYTLNGVERPLPTERVPPPPGGWPDPRKSKILARDQALPQTVNPLVTR